MTANYETPQSELVDVEVEHQELASRWARLAASLVDSLVVFVLAMPVMYLFGAFDSSSLDPGAGMAAGMVESLVMGLAIIALFVLINYRFLTRDGQTIGKKALSIRIVDLQGNIPDLKNNLIPRYAVYMLPGQIPVFGQLFSIVNVCFIFRGDKRCIHDLVGKTRVIKC